MYKPTPYSPWIFPRAKGDISPFSVDFDCNAPAAGGLNKKS